MRIFSSRHFGIVAALVFIAFLATVPLWATTSFAMSRYIVVLAYLMAALGLNLAMGYAGEFVLGHPVIMAAAAYCAGLLSALAGWPFWATLPAGVVAGTVVGVVIMSPGLRVRGWYYSLITMFAVLVLRPVVVLFEDWTGGENGLTGIRGVVFLGERVKPWMYLEFALICFVLMWLAVDGFVRSGWGHRMRALRDARHAAEAAGINLAETRLVVYVLSSIPAALGGVVLAYSSRFVGADDYGIGLMLMFLGGLVLGGTGTRYGPVVGMGLLLILSFWVGPFSPYNAIGVGVGLLVCSLLFPDGIIGVFAGRRGGKAGVVVPEHLAIGGAPVVRALSGGDGVVLKARGVGISFGGNRALSDVSLDVPRGAVIGLVGPNGSGKSTFLNVVSGFLRPDTGVVEIGGVNIAGMVPHRIARAGVQRSFQVPQLVDEFTAIENIEIGLVAFEKRAILGSILRAPWVRRRERARRARAEEVFAMVGLPEQARHMPVAKLPLGLKRVVEVGRAIASSPHLLLLDEPAAGLNDEERVALGLLLRRLQGIGITVLVVEHNVPFMLRFCDALVLLEEGAVVCTAPLDQPLPDRLARYLSYAPQTGFAEVVA